MRSESTVGKACKYASAASESASMRACEVPMTLKMFHRMLVPSLATFRKRSGARAVYLWGGRAKGSARAAGEQRGVHAREGGRGTDPWAASLSAKKVASSLIPFQAWNTRAAGLPPAGTAAASGSARYAWSVTSPTLYSTLVNSVAGKVDAQANRNIRSIRSTVVSRQQPQQGSLSSKQMYRRLPNGGGGASSWGAAAAEASLASSTFMF